MSRFLDRLEPAYNLILAFFIWLVAISIGLFALLIPLNLLLVKMQWGSIWWLNEGIEYSLYAGVFLGAPWVLQQGAHVRVDIVISALPKRLATLLEATIDTGGAVLCLVLAYYGWRAAVSEFVDGTLPDKDLRIPNWIMMAVFTVSLALLAIEFAFRIRRARQLVEEQSSATDGL